LYQARGVRLGLCAWIKERGLTDFVVREGFCSMRLPLNDKLKFLSGSVCSRSSVPAHRGQPALTARS